MDLNTLSGYKIKDLFENDKRLEKLLGKWSGLKNLVSLSLLAHRDLQRGSALPVFMKCLLKNLEDLETFHLCFSEYYRDEYHQSIESEYNFHLIDFDLKNVFGALQGRVSANS